MSISGISSDPTVSQNCASPFQQIRKDFQGLSSALQNGNLQQAQSAFATLQQDLERTGQAQTSQQAGTASGTFASDLAAIGTALGNGDLQGAQNALATMQKDMQQLRQSQGGQQAQGAHHHHHHHHGGGTQDAQGTTSNPLSDLASLGSALANGNLQGAQSAFQALTQNLGITSTPTTSGTSGTTGVTPGTDLTAIGTALQSGDLTGAQNAYATLMQDLQNSLATLGSSQAVGTNVNVST